MIKKQILIICVLLSMFFMTACEESVQNAPAKAPDIIVKVGEVGEGMVIEEIPVYVTFDGQPVACTTEWIIYFEEDYDYLDGKDKIPANYRGRVDVYYDLPKDVLLDDVPIRVESVNGTDDGTGDLGNNSVWTHIQFDLREEETVKETEEVIKQTESKAPEIKQETQKNEAETKPHVHSWNVNESKSVAASCDLNGWKQYECKGCSESYREDLPAYGHDWKSKVIKEPTCTEIGIKQHECSNCKWSYDEEISAMGHSMSSVTTNPESCMGQGSGVYRCGICGYEESYSISATGHSWGAAYSTSGRIHTRTCVACGEIQEEYHVFERGGIRCLVCGAEIIN